ncbi:hypothetical protein [Loktanella sp. Alg231-35]|uniref:hypothetical protein n=1 Tax=Loktanella sp. Alg231-35 TaxID=1922220 RepID=UPI000D5503BC|nr:hypothetical protein [Loktanella sp. Alg231-35]
MTADVALAKQIFERTALSSDDVVAERTVDLVIQQLQQSAMFFRERLDEGFFAEQSIEVARELGQKSERLAGQLAQDHRAEIEFDGEEMSAHLAAAQHIERLAKVLRGLNLDPEWKEYYDDIARKLNEYANGLRLDPESSFRFI